MDMMIVSISCRSSVDKAEFQRSVPYEKFAFITVFSKLPIPIKNYPNL